MILNNGLFELKLLLPLHLISITFNSPLSACLSHHAVQRYICIILKKELKVFCGTFEVGKQDTEEITADKSRSYEFL